LAFCVTIKKDFVAWSYFINLCDYHSFSDLKEHASTHTHIYIYRHIGHSHIVSVQGTLQQHRLQGIVMLAWSQPAITLSFWVAEVQLYADVLSHGLMPFVLFVDRIKVILNFLVFNCLYDKYPSSSRCYGIFHTF